MGSNIEVILSRVRKMQSHETSLATMIDIKEIVEWPDNRIVITVLLTRRFFRNLMNTLDSLQKAIIDISLSILSTCTLDKNFTRKAVEEYRLLERLQNLWIFYPEDQNVKKKMFEILGNVCKHNVYNLNHAPEFETLAIDMLKSYSTEQVSEDTLVMALRYLRLLLYHLHNEDAVMTNSNVIQVVSSFFREVILKVEVNENILQQTIELLQIYSEDGIRDFFSLTVPEEWILYLCNWMGFFLQRIPKIMSNIIKNNRLEDPLLLPDICDWIIQKVEDLNIEDSKDEYVAHITCLCFLLLEECEERHKKYLPQLIKVLKFVENPSLADVECFILIVMIFNRNCGFEASLAQELVDCDLLQALIEKLKWVSGKGALELDFDHEQDYNYFIEIPERSVAPGTCWRLDPRITYLYSATSTNDDENMTNDDDNMNTEDESECESSDCFLEEMKEVLQKEIVDLFHTYTCFHSSMPELASEELITALLNSSVHFGRTELYRTGTYHTEHLVHLMDTTVLEKIYVASQQQFQHNPSCAKCVTICRFCFDILERHETTASTNVGMAKIMDELTTDRIEHKAGIILAITYIFHEKSRIAHFLLQFDCLNCLAQLLKNGSFRKERIIRVLHVLASYRLAIADSTQVQISELSAAPVRKAAAKRNMITFKLDDGSTLRADRNLLTKRSWYFSVMLKGNFRESKRRKVDMHDTPNDLLRLMLQLLEKPKRIDKLVVKHDLEFLFDAIFFMELHGQSDLRSSLMSCIAKHRINPETVAAIYRRSIEMGLNLLRMEAATFALVHRIEFSKRVAMFDSLLDMGCTEQLTEDMQTILEESLRPHMRD